MASYRYEFSQIETLNEILQFLASYSFQCTNGAWFLVSSVKLQGVITFTTLLFGKCVGSRLGSKSYFNTAWYKEHFRTWCMSFIISKCKQFSDETIDWKTCFINRCNLISRPCFSYRVFKSRVIFSLYLGGGVFCDSHTQMILGVNFTLSSKLRLWVVFSRYFYSKVSRDTVYMEAPLLQQGALKHGCLFHFIVYG